MISRLLVLICCSSAIADDGLLTDVFVGQTAGYHTYRIPAVVVSQADTLLAFCEGRRSGRSDAGDIDLLLRRSTDGGKTWSSSIVIWDDGANTCGNPSPVVDQATGKIWLLMTWNLGSDHEKQIMEGTSSQPRQVYVTSSDDDGLTWSKPVQISDSVRKSDWRWYATGPGNAIQLTRGKHAGRMLIPANHSQHSDPDAHPYRSHVFWSDDHGAHWQLGGLHGDRTNESAVAELSGGKILQAMRSYHGRNRRALSRSSDGGATWSDVQLHAQLDTPVCQASLLRFSWAEGDRPGRLLFSSPKGSKRSHMTIWASDDDGESWPIEKEIYTGDAAYSNLVRLRNGKVGLLFERDGYSKISLWEGTVN